MSKCLPFIIYLIFALLELVLSALAWLLAPWLALYSVAAKTATLPGVWQWFSTADTDLDGGIHQHEYPDYSGRGRLAVWWYRMRWICRNPAQGFAHHLFGARCITSGPHFVYDVPDHAPGQTSGYKCWARGRLMGLPVKYFSLRGKWWPCRWLCLRYNFGWKLTRKDQYKMLVVSLALRFNFKRA